MQIKPKESELSSSSEPIKSIDSSYITALVQAVSSANLPATLVTKQCAAAALSVSPSTLKHYRKQHWLEGLHFFVSAQG